VGFSANHCYGHRPGWLCSNRIYAGKAYTQGAHQARGLAKRAIVPEHYQHEEHEGVLGVQGVHGSYIERVVSLMETIVFNSIQVTNYWFTLHRALGPLYQQAQTSSPNIRGISDQDVTIIKNFNVQVCRVFMLLQLKVTVHYIEF